MGSAAASEAGVVPFAPGPEPATDPHARAGELRSTRHTRLFVTPPAEVEVTCRLTLAQYLSSRLPDDVDLVHEVLLPSPAQGVGRSLVGRLWVGGEGRPPDHDRWCAFASAVRDLRIVDPACGEGHFLLGMLDVLDELLERATARGPAREDREKRRRSLVERNLFGVEVQAEALQRARSNLRAAIGRTVEGDEPRFNLAQGDSLVQRDSFSWIQSFPDATSRGGFDLVIGNPPYLRHEQIGDPLGLLSSFEYKRRARTAVEERLATFFAAEKHLDSRSDLCTLFTFLGLSLIHPRGALGFVLPTGSIQARYGAQLRKYLESSGWTATILESSSQRSFTAGVNTVILTAARQADGPGGICHVRTPKRLGDTGLATLLPLAPLTIPAPPAGAAERLLERLGDRMTGLSAYGRLRYPVKTGINSFFYPVPATVERFGIEPEFCRPVLKSPRSVRAISVQVSELQDTLFVCDRSPEQLEQGGKWGALSYIGWGASQRSAAGIPWPRVPSVGSRPYWYGISLPPPADIICSRFFNRRFFFVLPNGPVVEDQTFYGLLLDQPYRSLRSVIAALLSCSLTYLMIEVSGRSGLGEGVRQFALCDMAALRVPDVRYIEERFHPDLRQALEDMISRPILPIEEEVRQVDRQELDAIVAHAIGLRDGEMETIRATLVELTAQRLARASSLARSSRALASCSATRP